MERHENETYLLSAYHPQQLSSYISYCHGTITDMPIPSFVDLKEDP